MKLELQWIGISLWWVVLFGLIGPFLVSAENDIVVAVGFIAVLSTAYGTYLHAKQHFDKPSDQK